MTTISEEPAQETPPAAAATPEAPSSKLVTVLSALALIGGLVGLFAAFIPCVDGLAPRGAGLAIFLSVIAMLVGRRKRVPIAPSVAAIVLASAGLFAHEPQRSNEPQSDSSFFDAPIISPGCSPRYALGAFNASLPQLAPVHREEAPVAESVVLAEIKGLCTGEPTDGCVEALDRHSRDGRASVVGEVLSSLEALAQKGNADAATGIGYLHMMRLAHSPDFERASELLQGACAKGQGYACALLGGVLIGENMPLEQDIPRGLELAQKGCALEVEAGCLLVGYVHHHGMHGGVDLDKAIEIYGNWCTPEYEEGCEGLGHIVLDSDASQAQQDRVTRLLSAACQAQTGEACTHLAIILTDRAGGFEAKEDVDAAVIACEALGGTGCEWLGFAHSVALHASQALASATRLYEQGCELGSPYGCGNLGVSYEHGYGLAKNVQRANQLYQRACDDGATAYCGHLGLSYCYGDGVRADERRGRELLMHACNHDNGHACHGLARRYEEDGDIGHATALFGKACQLDYDPACATIASAAYHVYTLFRSEEEEQAEAERDAPNAEQQRWR